MKGKTMTKTKNVAMTLVWTYVAVASVYGLTKLACDTVAYVKDRKNQK
jgi:hypothetical protein